VAESRFAAIRTAVLTPFVGREQEFALLTERWQMASEGEGQVVLLSGEAGIGKSRVSEQLCEHVKGAGTRIRYQCSPYYSDTPLHPVTAQLIAAVRIETDDSSDIKLDKLESVILPGCFERKVALALLADLLTIPTGSRYPPLAMGSELRKVRTLQLLAEQLFALAARAPALALVEDAHWIDPTTRELIDSLIEPIGGHRILLLITCRPDFGNPWTHHANVTSLALSRLGQRQSAELAARAAKGEADGGIIEAVVARADGNPLFIEELTRSILESGLMTEPGAVALRGEMPPLAIPTTLQRIAPCEARSPGQCA
jgi:predicted ATPase